jgi:aminoglycoside phosphotransferase family enzyme/predicted kinase
LAQAAVEHERLVAALRNPACYAHPVKRVAVLETHISAVLLTGAFAYKIKKPVDLGFLDFRSLDARRHFCEEELRLNRRTAPQLYIEVVPITGSVSAPAVGVAGTAIEYALKMRQFPQEDLLDAMARRGDLSEQHIDALAQAVAAFHERSARADPSLPRGSPQTILELALQNCDQISSLSGTAREAALLERLRDWTRAEHERRRALFEARLRGGFVRECHGDLHLGNIALLDGTPTPFDCIEFSDVLRWIDVINETAFLFMDLSAHRLPGLAFGFLDAYLQVTGDYEGVALLPFYAAYRALVRAKVACIRAHQPEVGADERLASENRYRDHVQLALALASAARPALIIMHGVSGTGKSTLARQLVARLGAIRCRSDVERKRLHGLAALARSASRPGTGIYSKADTRRTYERLAGIAHRVLDAGYPVIVDAAFLRRVERERFRSLAHQLRAPFTIVSCTTPEQVLRERIAQRAARGEDPSEAGLSVLDRQLRDQEPLAPQESAKTLSIDTGGSELPPGSAAALAARLGIALI